MKTDSITVYTVGHGNRTLDELLRLLLNNAIKTLVDIRSYPYSRHFPHFSQDALREALNSHGMDYHWAGRQLGGMRKPAYPDSHPALTEDSLRGFAEYMQTNQFEPAVAQLLSIAAIGNTVILCAEKSPERCHRALICDYLLLKNIIVVHLLGDKKRRIHRMSASARSESNRLVYDRNVTGNLQLH
ncbi:MAG: DUF488 domain-containing protein [Gammaproteobacteria bacterium]|jgi:uncharacterized protein (DUF488 family)